MRQKKLVANGGNVQAKNPGNGGSPGSKGSLKKKKWEQIRDKRKQKGKKFLKLN